MESQLGAFFLDACIILNRVFSEDVNRTKKLFDDMNKKSILCYLSESVDTQCNIKIINTVNYIGDTLRQFLIGALQYLLKQQNRNLDDLFENNDIDIIEEVFITIYEDYELKATAKSLEEHIINIIENKIKNGEAFSFSNLIISITMEILRLSNLIQDRYENMFLMIKPKINIYEEKPDSKIVIDINENYHNINSPETIHLASVFKYEEKEKNKAVFITVNNEILKSRVSLNKKYKIIVSDPLYAIHKL